MDKPRKVVLYGAGVRGTLLCKANWESGSSIKIVAVTDSDPTRWGTHCFDHMVIPPDQALQDPTIPVCIDVSDSNAIEAIRDGLLQKYHVPETNFVEYSTLLRWIWETGKTADLLRKTPIKETRNPTSLIHDCNMGLDLGGISSWSIELCSELLNRGWKNLRIYVNGNAPPDKSIPKEWSALANRVDWIGSGFYAEHRPEYDTLQYLSEKTPCIIIANSEETLCAACVLKKLRPRQVQIISVLHSGFKSLYQSRARVKDLVDLFVPVSLDGLHGMERYGCKKSQIQCMSIPFDCEEHLIRSYSGSSDPVRIGYAGRLERTHKRADLLIEVIQLLVHKNLNFQLEIAGTGAYEKVIQDFIQKYALTAKVSLLGQITREDIPAFWRRQDVCVNISDFEGRSISITEAMGNGAVPVVTDVSGVRDDIVDGVNGYIVPVGDCRAMANRIEQLAQSRERLKIMGSTAHDAVYPKSRTEPHIQFWEGILSNAVSQMGKWDIPLRK